MQTIIVDTTPGYRMPTIYFSQGDVGRQFAIDLQSRFGDSLPSSPTVTIQATKPSGLGFVVAADSITNGVATFTLTATMTNEAGRFPAELKIAKNSVVLFTANFYLESEKSAHPEGTTDGDLDSILPSFMSVNVTTLSAGSNASYSFDPQTNTATFGIPKGADGSLASQVLAADYSSSKTYAVGDYVYYSGNLYRCTTAITTAEAWTSGHWTQVALANDVSDLKSDIDDIANLKYTTIDKSADVLTEYPTEGYINNNTGAFVPSEDLHCYYFTMPVSCSVWFDTQEDWGQIAVYNGDIFDTDALVSIGSLSRDTLPYENSKLQIKQGMNVVICIGEVAYDFSFHYAYDRCLSDEQLTYIDDSFDLTETSAKINSIVESEEFDYNKSSDALTAYGTDGYINNNTGAFVSLADYKCYSLAIDAASQIWFDPASDPEDWIQIAVYNGDIFDTTKWLGTYSVSRSTLPTENSKLSVASGVNIVVCRYTTNDFMMHITNNADFIISDEQMDYIKEQVGEPRITIEKISSTEFNVIVPNKRKNNTVVYNFVKYNKVWATLDYIDAHGDTQQATDVLSADYWNNLNVLDKDGNVLVQGNSNFIVMTTDSPYHSGDGHGNEVNDYCAFLCDGAVIDIDNASVGIVATCSDFRMIERGRIFKVGGCTDSSNNHLTSYPALDTDGNPVVRFKHFMEMHISTGNEVEIKNKLLVMENGISFNGCYGAMLQCMFGSFTTVICNNTEETRNTVSSDGTFTVPSDSTVNLRSQVIKCDSVELYGDDFYVRQEMHQDDVTRKAKSNVDFYCYTNRLKCYFYPVTWSGVGETAEVFNTGDVISVTDYRVIDLY